VKRWDQYFYRICGAVASNSRCHSRQIGAIIVRDKSIVSTGYNGPARGIPHCGPERFKRDSALLNASLEIATFEREQEICPRKLMGFKSGEGLEWCIAAHAERNCISNAARLGVSTLGTTLYMNDQVCCKDCLTELINAGIERIVVTDAKAYDRLGYFIIKSAGISIRIFEN